MNLYITTGTFSFLKRLQDKRANLPLILLNNPRTAALIHETDQKTIFSSARKFEVLDGFGPLKQEGFFALYNIPVSIEDRPAFEFELKNKLASVKNEYGIHAMRLLRPIKSETYVVMTTWKGEQAYAKWNSNELFTNKTSPFNTQVLFTGNPYTVTFHAYKEENK
jgi:heme-degrading monooxygenase HmoA